MCGIAGIISKKGQEAEIIRSMAGALKRRGPDAEGFYRNDSGTVLLGHTRLCVIDLSPAANQPFVAQNGRYIAVFNGEIYNFQALRQELQNSKGVKFKTSSDTEVLVEAFSAWGADVARKLEGMFAVAITDIETNTLYLFRDRMGKKPLMYYHDGDQFIFGSEIKALLLHPRIAHSLSLDQQAISNFFHLGYIPEPHTIYNSIRKFPSGHIGIVGSDLKFSCEPFWKIEDEIAVSSIVDPLALTSELKARLISAVEKRLISDVPLGVFLSGGVDSSLVAAIASRSGKSGLKSFSIGFHSRVFDESRQARAVASYLGTEHYNYMLDETEAVGMIDDYFQYFDEPFADSSAIPTMLISKIARQHVTVALTGDGGDELFLGYGAYDWANRLDNPLLAATKGLIKNVAIAYGNNRLKRIASLLGNVTDRSLIRSHIFSQEQYLFSHEELSRLLPANYTPFQYCDPVTSRELTSSERQALFDLKYYLKDDLLVKVDRASMFSSLECRCPLLDKNVVALAMQIPEKYKRRGNVRKWILTQVLNDFLPANLIPQRKRGFSIPLSGWLKNQLKYLVDDSLSPEYVAHAGLVNFSEVKALLTRFHNGEEYLYNRIWCLVVMHKWLKEHASILP